ncbi:MAG: glycosyltransferase family 4 protein [Acidobacteriota bacterium]|nr:glycosyltransferase family 4 protein [Acidobacteriota bacterium]
MLKVALLDYRYETRFKTPEAMFQAYRTSLGVAAALRKRGIDARIFGRFHRKATFRVKDVPVHLIADSFPPALRLLQVPKALHRAVLEMKPDVVHVHGLGYPPQIRHLVRAFPGPVVVQDHAERPLHGLARLLQARCLRRVQAFLFAHRALAEPWIQAGVIDPARVSAVMEDASEFQPGDRAEAQRQCGLKGDPVFLWVGRLDANKDPLTVLQAFRTYASENPAARLVMIFHEGDLEGRVRAAIADDAALRGQVQLVGKLPHEAMETWYRAADYFILGSHHEGSGYALMEALACGLRPLVTDIPTFRALTAEGRQGRLWPPGDVQVLLDCLRNPPPIDPVTVSARYHREMGMNAIARGLNDVYTRLARSSARGS